MAVALRFTDIDSAMPPSVTLPDAAESCRIAAVVTHSSYWVLLITFAGRIAKVPTFER